MATSGAFESSYASGVDSGYPAKLRTEWSRTEVDTAGNRSKIHYRMFATGGTITQANIQLRGAWLEINGSRAFTQGGVLTVYNDTTVAEGDVWIGHNGDGTKTFNMKSGGAFYYSGQNSSGSADFTLDTIARQVNIGNVSGTFNSQTVSANISWTLNGNRVDLKLEAIGKDPFKRWNNLSGSSGTFTLTAAEIDEIEKYVANSNSTLLRWTITTVINGEDRFMSWRDTTFQITNSNPVFSNYAFSDTNVTTTAITGNNQYLIQGVSTLGVNIPAGASSALNYATMKTYSATFNGKTVNVNWSASAVAIAMGAHDIANNGTLSVRAVDSRGNQTTVNKTVNVVPYTAPTVIARGVRQNDFENPTTIHIEGSMSLISVGGVTKNAVNAASGVAYRYKASASGEWGGWVNVASVTNAQGKVSTTDFVLNLDNNTEYNFEVRITDKLRTSTTPFSVSVGTPIFRVGVDGNVYNKELRMPNFGNMYTGMAPQPAAVWDFNKMIEPQMYCLDSSANMGTALNKPPTCSWGFLVVYRRTDRGTTGSQWTTIFQEYMDSSGNNWNRRGQVDLRTGTATGFSPWLRNDIPPINTVILTSDNVNPASKWGGGWIQYSPGRVVRGFGSNGTTNYASAGATGGAEMVALSVQEMPIHKHRLARNDAAGEGGYLPRSGFMNAFNATEVATRNSMAGALTDRGGNYHDAGTMDTAGYGNSHENRDAFTVGCYWRRSV